MLRIVLLATTLTLAASAATIQLITNGGFESGTSGWSSTETLVSPNNSCATLWTIATNGSATNCVSIAGPYAGSNAAYTSFDGYGAGNGSGRTEVQNYTLAQSIIIPDNITDATLSFYDTYNIFVCSCYTPPVLPRTFHIELKNSQGTLLSTLLTQQFVAGNQSQVLAWTLNSVDATTSLQSLAGQTVGLEIIATVPQYFTGAGGFALDNVSLSATVSDAPEPASYSLLVGALGLLTASLRKRVVKRQ